MSLPERLPAFDELPIKPDYPPHSAWAYSAMTIKSGR